MRHTFVDTIAEIANVDPLFAAEGMNLYRASSAINHIERNIKIIERICSENSLLRFLFLKRYPLSSYAIPLSFLRSFVESEYLRRTFLKDPSAAAARALVDRWAQTQRQFETSVRRYRKLHQIFCQIEKPKSTFSFADMFGNVTSLEDVDIFLDLLQENSLVLAHCIDKLRDVIAGACNAYSVSSPVAEKISIHKGRLSRVHSHLHTLATTHSLPFRRSDICECYGPLVYTSSIFDSMPTPHSFFVYVVRNRKTNLESVALTLSDRFYFLTIAGSNARFGPVGATNFDMLMGRGIKYFFQPATNLYATRETRHWADLTTFVDINYRRPELNHDLVLAQKSSMLDLVLGTCAEDIDMYIMPMIQRRIKGALGLSYSYLYGLLSRSLPGIFFMPYNASVWRLPSKLNLLGSRRVDTRESLYVTDNVIVKETTQEELKTIMKSGHIREDFYRAAGYDEMDPLTFLREKIKR